MHSHTQQWELTKRNLANSTDEQEENKRMNNNKKNTHTHTDTQNKMKQKKCRDFGAKKFSSDLNRTPIAWLLTILNLDYIVLCACVNYATVRSIHR